MYKIIDILDKDGNHKRESLERIEKKHSLYGYFVFKPRKNVSFEFMYGDNSWKALRSSTVTDVVFVEDNGLYIITTLNSIYYIKEVERINNDN